MLAAATPPGASGPEHDRWMAPWLAALRTGAAGGPVLELGCDDGGDTAWLQTEGLPVVAGDISHSSLLACGRAARGAHLLRIDLRQPLPFAGASFGAVVASLCLHYFDWATTVAAVAEVRRCLRPGGLLLCRLNSTGDVHHGACGFEEIEPHFFRVNGRYAETKRFFDAQDVDRLFTAGWTRLAISEKTIHRYAEPKRAWEIALRRAPDAEPPTMAA